ncbi:MAG TPA: hypothetical protein VLE72_01025 [Candidatus Saccharimonadales bacterium]|nr:hypothetical protein [Candidatus Saccharimonadales bacterium]
MSINWFLAVSLFFAYMLVDGLYAYYTIAVVKNRALVAASTSFFMHFLLAAGVFAYTKNFAYVLPLALGSFVGTFLVVKHHSAVI